MTDDRIPVSGTYDERRVLGEALDFYRHRAEKRQDPTFRPEPGKKDRNLEIMRVADIVKPHIARDGDLYLITTPEMRRVIRGALEAYATERGADAAIIECDVDTALALRDRVPEGYLPRVAVARG